MPTIDPTPPVTYYGEKVGTEARLPVQSLDQEDFLKLLVAQMTSQDPLNPKSEIELIPQLVSFSTLAQSQSMQQEVNVNLSDGTQFVRGQILLQNFTDPQGLMKEGNNQDIFFTEFAIR